MSIAKYSLHRDMASDKPRVRVRLCTKRSRDARIRADLPWEGEATTTLACTDQPDVLNPTVPLDPKHPSRIQIGPFYTYKPLPVSQRRILERIHVHFTPEVLDDFVDMFFTSSVPLRLYDWLVTNYTKENPIVQIIHLSDGTQEILNIHEAYKSQRWAQRKRHFGFFKKKVRVAVDHRGKTYETAVTQLNMFLFVRKHKLRDILKVHYHDVLAHYTKSMTSRNERRAKNRLIRKSANKTALGDRCLAAFEPVQTRLTLMDEDDT